MSRNRRLQSVLALAILLVAASIGTAGAEVTNVRVSRGFGIHYLPLYVMEEKHFLERHAATAGLGTVTVEWSLIDGGNAINDAMLSGALDIGSIGVPGFLTLWAKAKGDKRQEVMGLGGVGGGSMYLNTRNPDIKSLRDFTEKDKIALPGIKTSFAAFILQMAVAKEFGDANYAKLDPLTVGMPYPEAVAALTSGKTEITAHVASPPFSFIELEHPGIHRVFNSVDIIGPTTVIMAYARSQFREANPKMTAAFVAALAEADDFTTRNKDEAARIYAVQAKVKTSPVEVRKILDDPDLRFALEPDGIMLFADFMQRAGIIKAKPASWKDTFFPELRDLPGGS